jgi:hypothetical protein
MDKEALKKQLERYLKGRGVAFSDSGKFLCPFHDDHEPTMQIVPGTDGKIAHCFACDASADIFKIAARYYALDIQTDFPEIQRRVAGELGRSAPEAPQKQRAEKPPAKPVTLTLEAARVVYTKGAIERIGKFIFADALREAAEIQLEKIFLCKNETGAVEFIEARFLPSCFKNDKKRAAALWWNGQGLRAKNTPHGLFGRELLARSPDKPVLIVEGPKCQEAAKALTAFVPIAWNGGANGQKRIDFSPLAGRRVYIWPDDDEAGGRSARDTAKLIQHTASEVIIVNPLPEARAIKPEKADIVEALEVKTPDEITGYILNHTPPAEAVTSSDPYISAGLFLAGQGFYKIYDKKATAFYSTHEEQPYNFSEIRDKFSEDKINGLNPAKMAKMINNLDPVYPVYHLVKSFAYPPRHMGRGKDKSKYIINRWNGFRFPAEGAPPDSPDVEAETGFIKRHIKDIICGGSEADYEYFCKWVAHLFQKPDIKPGVAIFAHSDTQGTGKSLIFEHLIPNMIGVDITMVFTNEEQIAEKFNAWLFESLYVVFSEKSFYSHTESIKGWITDPNHGRRDMGTESRQERSFARFVICTNQENAFRFDESERRMFVINVSNKMALAGDDVKWPYFNRLGAAVNSAAVLNSMARFFCSIDITNFNPFNLPDSEKKRHIIEAEKHPVIDFFESVAYGEDPHCQLLKCSEIDPNSNENYHKKAPGLYEAIKAVAKDGEYFIERKRLFEQWQKGYGKNWKFTMNKFGRVIKNHYPPEQIEIINEVYRENGKTAKLPVVIVKKAFFERKAKKGGQAPALSP